MAKLVPYSEYKEARARAQKLIHDVRMHPSIQSLKEDFDLLKKYGIDEKNIVTEVSEDDYSTRVDQLKEIQMLEELQDSTFSI